MSKLSILVILAVLVACTMANKPRVCRHDLGEKLKGPGRVCEWVCTGHHSRHPLERCVKTAHALCLCSRKAGYCRNKLTGRCQKKHHSYRII